MPDYKEVVIRVDLNEEYVEVWTDNAKWKRLLEKRRFKLIATHGKGAWYKGTLGQVSIKNPKRALTDSQKEAARAAGERLARAGGRQKRDPLPSDQKP